MAEKNEVTFLLQDYTAEFNTSSELSFSCSFEVDGIKGNECRPVEYQLLAYTKGVLVYCSASEITILDNNCNLIHAHCGFCFDTDNLPDEFLLKYRFFGDQKTFVAEPKIPSRKGDLQLTEPPKSLFGSSKWSAANFALNSIVVKNEDGDFDIKWTGQSSKQTTSLLRVRTISGSEESDFETVLKSPYITEYCFVGGSNKLSLSFDLFRAEKWIAERIADVSFSLEDDVALEDHEYEHEFEGVEEQELEIDSDVAVSGLDWQEVSTRALNWYFNTVRKTDDIHDAEQMFLEEITGALEDAKIEWDEFPYDIPIDVLEKITASIEKHLEFLRKEHPHYAEGIFDPFETYFDGVLWEYSMNDELPEAVKSRAEALHKKWQTP